MYIKSIVLDGFKSYGRRTEVKGFDPQFTAVTGLNGSGKSNIIDSICFVLGITNLTNVRVTSLQDLIYKSGQAGINKATVTINFDNTDKKQSPPGFENYNEIVITRQVVIGGKNKYLLNGLSVTNKRIQDLFCSVQLNVNNPHFLIMQGKITKVLNMKPPEILAMVEEAAGTRMYEVKKQIAIKNLEKKNLKLQELEKVMHFYVEPRITKLHEERAKVFELQQLEGELAHRLKLFEAWEFHIAEIRMKGSEDKIKKVEEEVANIRNNIEENVANIKTLDEEAENMMKDSENLASTKLKDLESKLKEQVKLEAEVNAVEKASKESVNSEERNIKQLEKNLKIDENALKSKEQDLAKTNDLYENLKNNENTDGEALAACQKRYEAICAGMEVNDSGEAQTLMSQLMNAKQELMQAETDIKVSQDELEYSRQQLKEKQANLGSETTTYAEDKVQLESLQKDMKNVKNVLNKLRYSEEHMNQLHERKRTLTNELRRLRDNTERFYASKPYTRFIYTDPENNFDKGSVHGLVCDLIDIQNKTNCIAIETAAGSMLYSVVVDTDVVSKKLINKGNLQHRTTFIPLNKIRANRMSPNVIKEAYRLVGKENITPALDVISYNKRLQPAMESIFGNVFITRDLNIAKTVCFHEGIRKRCVTLDGDVVDPAGTLSGGSMQNNASILKLLEDIKKQEIEYREMENEFDRIQADMQSMMQSKEQWTKHSAQLELIQHQSNVISKRLEQTTHHMQVAEVQQLKVDITNLTEKVKLCEEKRKHSQKIIKDLEHKMKDSKGHQEKQRKEIENELKNLRKKAEKSKEQWMQREEEYRTLTVEIEELKKTIENTKEEIKTAQANIVNLKEKYEQSGAETAKIKVIVKELQDALQAEKSVISAKNKNVQQKYKAKNKLIEQNNEFELEIKKIEYELKKAQDEYKMMKGRFSELSRKCKDADLIDEARKLSEAEGRALEAKLRKGTQRKNELSKTVNMKAHQLFEHETRAYENLKTKIIEVKKDLAKIKDTIKKLDNKKQEIINKAFNQVTKDLSSILSTLLPGADAKLKIPNGKTILQGLEIKVALGGVWKDSLDELSGGQRSLVALSFILAMLLFKPAPLYILDEVDAALDLSHTQNIGAMLKQHFKQSQFVIISLKDGMFNNANVLFKTQFIDGVSTVSRTSNL
ncbi:structural maintenance of chromosomes protein 3 [Holotrichia oblita]|uniref:Structural maintenance of chromosomes protein 3 n=1 Tax=Holotrichia oblita TaxID=644536 RepID=A0ACB9TPM2_HOLOL|nr:structural maintenance of chromosomes protein 3 [Holotrichia oblita]